MQKKIVLTLIVVGSLSIYSIYTRLTGAGQMALAQPKILKTTPSSSPLATTIVPTTIGDTTSPTPTAMPTSKYKDGNYTGSAADAFYGNIQVEADISGGKITNVKFLQYPNDRQTSVFINSQADPMLAQEAIQAQSANVDIVSGATDSSQAFIQSLQSALSKAAN